MMWKMDSRTQELIRGEVTKEMIDILAAKAARIIQCKRTSENDRRVSGSSESSISSSPLSSSATIDDSEYYQSENKLISLRSFITNLVIKSKVHAGTLICTVEYLDRLKRKLPSGARGIECTCHRIFLASLIIAGKYLNDASPKNKYWARYSTMFSLQEVNLMEKQFLFLIDFDLRITPQDLDRVASLFYKNKYERAAMYSVDPIEAHSPYNTLSLKNPCVAHIPAQKTYKISEGPYSHSLQNSIGHQNKYIASRNHISKVLVPAPALDYTNQIRERNINFPVLDNPRQINTFTN